MGTEEIAADIVTGDELEASQKVTVEEHEAAKKIPTEATEKVTAEELETSKPTELEEKVIRQIEYYFGNFNLAKDKFLKEAIKNDEGWVPLETLIRFNRLKQITEDFKVISEALKKSPNQLMEVNDDCTKIRRKIPPPQHADKDEIDERTLYVKGFNRSSKLDEILDFFKEYKVENVFMRKQKVGKRQGFKGSVFATFETKELSEDFLSKTGIKYGSMELLREKKKDYIKRKDEFYDNLRAEKEKKIAAKKSSGEGTEASNTGGSEGEIKKGCLLGVSGITNKLAREDIKEATEKFGTVVYIDYNRGNAEAVVRFEEGVVPEFITTLEEEDGEKILEICSLKLKVHLIEGEDEIKYWKKIAENKANARARMGGRNYHQGNKGRFNKNQRGRRFNKRQRNNEESSTKEDNVDSESTKDEPPIKRVKVEAGDETKAIKSEIKSEPASCEAME